MSKNTFILIFILSVFKIFPTWAQEDGQTLLAIFAHPDDEMTVAPILAKYADEGVDVHLVICTDGRYGTNDFSGLESGDSLVKIRRDEMKCSAEKLGVKLTHLTFHDQLKAGEGYDGHMPHARNLIKELTEIVDNLSPDVILTWGLDGGTNHLDHRLVGASVTQVFQSKARDNMKLYYVGTPSDLLDDDESKTLRGVDRSYLKTAISYTEKELQQTASSLECHKSQLQPKSVERIVENMRNQGMTVYLRQFTGPLKKENSVFD